MHITVIINALASRRVRARIAMLVHEDARRRDIEMHHTESAGHAALLAREAVSRGTGMLVVVGGDGTVNEVINGTAGANITISVIPAGSANDLATYHHIPTDVDRAWTLIDNHDVLRLDAVSVNGWLYTTGGGLGLPCDIVRRVNAMRCRRTFAQLQRLGLAHCVYAGSLIRHALTRKPECRQFTVESDTGQDQLDAVALLIMNQPSIGHHFLITRNARTADGLLEVVIIRSVQTWLRILPVIARSLSRIPITNSPRVESRTTRTLRIRSDRSLPFMGDGELLLSQSEFVVRAIPGAIRLAVPQNPGGTQ
jgi:diacylglycerol kinase (ATP)